MGYVYFSYYQFHNTGLELANISTRCSGLFRVNEEDQGMWLICQLGSNTVIFEAGIMRTIFYSCPSRLVVLTSFLSDFSLLKHFLCLFPHIASFLLLLTMLSPSLPSPGVSISRPPLPRLPRRCLVAFGKGVVMFGIQLDEERKWPN